MLYEKGLDPRRGAMELEGFDDEVAPAEKDEWVKLRDPAEVFADMVPKKVRFNEPTFGSPAAADVNACHDGDDDRSALKSTLSIPNRWICKLQIAYFDPVTKRTDYSEGSGLLIGERHVLTAAHNLMDAIRDASGKFLRANDAAAIVVIPALDGRGRKATARAVDTMPFGWVRGSRFRVNSTYRSVMRKAGHQPSDFDYAMVELAVPLGRKTFPKIGNKRFSYWGAPEQRGRTRIRVLRPRKLKNVKVNAVGYPGDKCLGSPRSGPVTDAALAACRSADRGSVPWFSFEKVRSAGANHSAFAQLVMDHDFAPGMSGGPVWLRWKGIRNLIGINQSCTRSKTTGKITSANAVRISKAVKRDIVKWMR